MKNKYQFVIGAYNQGGNGLHLIEVHKNKARATKVFEANNSIAYLCNGKENNTFYGCVEELGTGKFYKFAKNDNNEVVVDRKLKINGSALCHISLINDRLYGSCYMSGNMLICDDNLSQLKEIVFDNSLLPRAHYHSTCVSKCKNYILCSDLGKDKIYVFTNDSQNKLLYTLDLLNKSGPRDIIFFNNSNGFCVSLEKSNQLAVFILNECTMQYELVKKYNLHDKNIKSIPSNLCLTINDDFIFVANRGENSILVYSIDKRFNFTKVIETECFGNWPRHIMLSKDNQKLICCNRRSNNVILFDVDFSNANIIEKTAVFNINTPSCAIEI